MRNLSNAKRKLLVLAATVSALAVPAMCFADTTPSAIGTVATTIEDAGTSMLTNATPVIAAAIGVGLVFWGAKVLWNKFKGMAK